MVHITGTCYCGNIVFHSFNIWTFHRISTRQWPGSSCCKTVALLSTETPDFIGQQYWPPNSPDLLGHLQKRVYRHQMRDVHHLKVFMNGTALISISLTKQSASGDSVCVTVSARMADTLNIRFKHCHCKTKNKFLLSSCSVVRLCDFVYSLISQYRWDEFSRNIALFFLQ